jgi:hypothetical protein
MLMEMFMKVNGRMTKPTDMADICTQTEQNTKDTGKKINSMEKEKKPGPTVPATKEIMLREKKMVLVNLDGQMVAHMKVNLLIIIFMVEEPMFGLIIECSMVNG